MKHLSKGIFVLIAVSFLLAPFGVLQAAQEEVKKEDTGKHCCFMSKNDSDKDKTEFKAEYKGKTYYFCCEKCKAEFEKDPEKCLQTCKDKDKCCEAKVSYVCPMKQCEVKTDKPGKCPKCGMELKKVVEHTTECKHHKEEQEHEHEHKHDTEHKHEHKQ